MSKRSTGIVILLGAIALWPMARPAQAEPAGAGLAPGQGLDAVFADRKLVKVGFWLETAGEVEMHAAVASVRGLKAKCLSEAARRESLTREIDSETRDHQYLLTDLAALDKAMDKAKKKPNEWNQMVGPHNEMVEKSRRQIQELDDLKRKLSKVSDSQADYDAAATAGAKLADDVAAEYEALAGDETLKAAIVRYNRDAREAVRLGPSGTFSSDAAFLKKCLGEIQAQGVPIQMRNGVPVVVVSINGRSREMIWDSGASLVSLSAQAAADFGLHVPDSAPTVEATIADGSVVKNKLIMIAEIKIGIFSARNIACSVSPSHKGGEPDLLGGAFQHHFICRLDQDAGVLHLTPIDDMASATASPAPSSVHGLAPQGVGSTNNSPTARQTGPGASPSILIADDWAPPKRIAPATMPAASRHDVPAKADRIASSKSIKEVYAELLSDRSIVGRKKLIAALLDQADRSAAAPSDQFALLAVSVQAASAVGHLPLAFAAADRMAQSFDVDSLAIKVDCVGKLPVRGLSSDLLVQDGPCTTRLIDQLVQAEDFADANRVCSVIAQAYSSEPSMQASVQTVQRDISAMADLAAAASKSFVVLKTTPNDASANLDVGKYLCFCRNDWRDGLAALAHSGDASLQILATTELSDPHTAGAQAALGDMWWASAEGRASSFLKSKFQARAAFWYRIALPGVDGLPKLRIEKRLADLPSAGAPGGLLIVDAAGAPEARRIIAEAAQRSPGLLNGVRSAELVAFHDGSAMKHRGGVKTVAGAYSGASCAAGSGTGITFSRLYEQWPAGRYLIVYRVQELSEVHGDDVCFLDVCREGTTVAGAHPPAESFQPGRWSALPLPLLELN